MTYQHQGFPKYASESKDLNNIQVPSMYANMERHPTETMGTNALAEKERREL